MNPLPAARLSVVGLVALTYSTLQTPKGPCFLLTSLLGQIHVILRGKEPGRETGGFSDHSKGCFSTEKSPATRPESSLSCVLIGTKDDPRTERSVWRRVGLGPHTLREGGLAIRDSRAAPLRSVAAATRGGGAPKVATRREA